MSLKPIADHLASKGRGDDSVLIHMTPGEVHGLQALAMAHGGSLTINPSTGLPEAGFLKSILPTLVGLGVAMIPGVGIPAATMLGAGVGALSNSKNPLMGALMGGLGAYGGAGLASGFNAAGAAAAAAEAAPGAASAATEAGMMTSPEWAGQAATAVTPPVQMPLPPTGPMSAQLPSIVPPNPMVPPVGGGVVPSLPSMPLDAAPVSTGAASVGEVGQGLEPWPSNAFTQPRQLSPFEKIGAAFEKPEAFMKGVEGPSGLIKSGAMAAAPALLAPSDKEQKKPWWATAELPQYTYERGYTGGVPVEGAAYTGQRRYFDPRFVRMAEGGSVEDQLANARRASVGFKTAANIMGGLTNQVLTGTPQSPTDLVANSYARAQGLPPRVAQPAAGIAALQSQAAAAPVYMMQQAPGPVFNFQPSGGRSPSTGFQQPGLQTGARAIDMLSQMPSTASPMPRYADQYVGPMTGESAAAARYLAGSPSAPRLMPAPVPMPARSPGYQPGFDPGRVTIQPVRPAATIPSAPTYAAPVPTYSEPAPTYAAPVPSYSEPVPTYAAPAPTYAEPADGIAALMPVYGAPTYAPPPMAPTPAPAQPAPAPDYAMEQPRVTTMPVSPAPTPAISAPTPAAPAPTTAAPPPPLSLDELIKKGQPTGEQTKAANDAWLSTYKSPYNKPDSDYMRGMHDSGMEYLQSNPDLMAAARASGQDPYVFAYNHYNANGRFENRPGTGSMDAFWQSRQPVDYGGGNAAGGQLKSGGFVVPADVVSALGNGSTDAGLEVLMRKYNAKPIDGPGDGMSDSIPTTIEGRQKARVARGEAYIQPEDVQKAGGSKQLYSMLDRIRKNAHGKTTQQRKVNPNRVA